MQEFLPGVSNAEKIFLTGASGVLGRELIRQLKGRGHQVRALIRSPRKAGVVKALGAVPVEGSLFNAQELTKLASGCSVVIHAATAIPGKPRTKKDDWQVNDSIRRTGTSALVECVRNIGARKLIIQSITWVAKPDDGSFFDEESEVNLNWVTASSYDGEQIAMTAAEKFGFDCLALRCGFFYSAAAGSTIDMVTRLKKKRMPIIGSGDALMNLCHVKNAASAFVTGIEADCTGVFHICDSKSPTVKEFFSYLSQKTGADQARHIPAWAARVGVGSYLVDFFTISTDTSHRKFTNSTLWQPMIYDYKTGIDQVVSEWNM